VEEVFLLLLEVLMCVVKYLDHLLDLVLVSLHFEQGFIDVLLFPPQQFVVPLLLLADGAFQQSDLVLVAHVQLLDCLAQVGLVLLELFDARLLLVVMAVVVVVGETHLNIGS
jgi:hypothetical protein